MYTSSKYWKYISRYTSKNYNLHNNSTDFHIIICDNTILIVTPKWFSVLDVLNLNSMDNDRQRNIFNYYNST